MSAQPPLSWRPSATHAALRRRAALIARLRNFFAAAACWKWRRRS